jgi:hypothetical protein
MERHERNGMKGKTRQKRHERRVLSCRLRHERKKRAKNGMKGRSFHAVFRAFLPLTAGKAFVPSLMPDLSGHVSNRFETLQSHAAMPSAQVLFNIHHTAAVVEEY